MRIVRIETENQLANEAHKAKGNRHFTNGWQYIAMKIFKYRYLI